MKDPRILRGSKAKALLTGVDRVYKAKALLTGVDRVYDLSDGEGNRVVGIDDDLYCPVYRGLNSTTQLIVSQDINFQSPSTTDNIITALMRPPSLLEHNGEAGISYRRSWRKVARQLYLAFYTTLSFHFQHIRSRICNLIMLQCHNSYLIFHILVHIVHHI